MARQVILPSNELDPVLQQFANVSRQANRSSCKALVLHDKIETLQKNYAHRYYANLRSADGAGNNAVRHRGLRATFYEQWLVFPSEEVARAAL